MDTHPYGSFLSECCEATSLANEYVSLSNLYRAYVAWCGKNNIFSDPLTVFTLAFNIQGRSVQGYKITVDSQDSSRKSSIESLMDLLSDSDTETLTKPLSIQEQRMRHNIDRDLDHYEMVKFTGSDKSFSSIQEKSYIYLLRTKEHMLRAQQFYVIDTCTQNPNTILRKLTTYPKGSEIILVLDTPSSRKSYDLMRILHDIFSKQFITHRLPNGLFYEGDVNLMRLTLWDKISALWKVL